MKFRKKCTQIGVIIIVVICVGMALLNFRKAETKSSENNDLTKYAELQKDEISLKNKLGENTPYPELYLMAEALVELKGVDSDRAIAKATERYVEKRALVWYAEKKRIYATNSEFEQHLDLLISSAKQAENYDELNDAYKNAGTSLEEIYRGNSSYYRDDYIIGKLYDQWISNYTKEEQVSENTMKSMDSAWENWISEVNVNYKKSQSYKILQPALKGSIKMYNKGVGDDVKALKATSAIYISKEKK